MCTLSLRNFCAHCADINGVQRDVSETTARIPIVLGGSGCLGSEETLDACPNYVLGRAPKKCSHDRDVHLLCFNDLNAGMVFTSVSSFATE